MRARQDKQSLPEIRFATGPCSLGILLVARSDRGVCAIFLGDDPDQLITELRERFHRTNSVRGGPELEALVVQVTALIEHPETRLNLPLDIQGTAFQHRVWSALREIPSGRAISYSALATRIGAPRSARAIAQACAANRIAVAIPCHRVVRADGGLSGYRWGVQRKHALQQREVSAQQSRRNDSGVSP